MRPKGILLAGVILAAVGVGDAMQSAREPEFSIPLNEQLGSLLTGVSDPAPASAPVEDPGNNPAEIARIQAHLAQVERELLAADVSHFSPQQRANRLHHIAVLRQYRERGVFPHNHVSSERTPVFIDEHDTHCAVGYLLAQSGHGELARRISNERNLARVPELADEPELVAWLEKAGLSVAEAARIQPWYGPSPSPSPTQSTDNSYAVATAVAAGVSGGAVVWNLLSDRQGSSWWVPGAVGLAVGVADGAFALGGHLGNSDRAADLPDPKNSDAMIGVNVAMGLVSAVMGARTLALGRSDRPADPVSNDGAATLEIAPWTAPRGGSGFRLAVRF